MTWKLLSLLAGVTLSGCAVVPTSSFSEPLSRSAEAMTNPPKIDPTEVTGLQPGSQVKIASSNDSVVGTVLQANPEGIVLINCIYMNRNERDQLISKRHIPCHWMPLRRIAKIETIAAAPADFVLPSVEINTRDTEEFPGGRKGIEF